jgi:hypothetical protein
VLLPQLEHLFQGIVKDLLVVDARQTVGLHRGKRRKLTGLLANALIGAGHVRGQFLRRLEQSLGVRGQRHPTGRRRPAAQLIDLFLELDETRIVLVQVVANALGDALQVTNDQLRPFELRVRRRRFDGGLIEAAAPHQVAQKSHRSQRGRSSKAEGPGVHRPDSKQSRVSTGPACHQGNFATREPDACGLRLSIPPSSCCAIQIRACRPNLFRGQRPKSAPSVVDPGRSRGASAGPSSAKPCRSSKHLANSGVRAEIGSLRKT